MLVPNPKGNYAFVQGIARYSAGAVGERGFEIIQVRFPQPLPLVRGFERVKAHLTAMQRPLHAMCGMELRSPKPFTFAGFGEFNGGYIQVLKDWGLFLE